MLFWSKIKCCLGIHDYIIIEVRIAETGERRALLRCENCKSYFHCLVLSDKLYGIWPLGNWKNMKDFWGM
jgi:hypothetical protein